MTTNNAPDGENFVATSEGDVSFNAGIWSQSEFAGVAGFLPIDWAYRNVEIGYWLAENMQGRGLVTAAVRAMVTHAFRVWKLNRVQIRCAAGNIKSQAIPRRLGFAHEGTLRQAQLVHGVYHDLLVFGMLRGEWSQ